MLERRLSQTLGQIKKGFSYDSPLGGMPVVQAIPAPDAASATAVHAAITVTTATQKITTNITNPDVPRNLVIAGNQAGADTSVTIVGRDFAGRTISETIVANDDDTVVGSKAFAVVSYILVGAKAVPGGDTISIGIGSKLGLKRPIAATGSVSLLAVDFVAEAAAAVSVANNTVTATTALNGAKNVVVYYDTYLV